jgi:hypothetical protein
MIRKFDRRRPPASSTTDRRILEWTKQTGHGIIGWTHLVLTNTIMEIDTLLQIWECLQ